MVSALAVKARTRLCGVLFNESFHCHGDLFHQQPDQMLLSNINLCPHDYTITLFFIFKGCFIMVIELSGVQFGLKSYT